MDKLITEVNIETESTVGLFLTFQRRTEFHPARKPFVGFSNGSGGGSGDVGDFKLKTLNSSCSDHTKHGLVQGRGEQPAKKVDGSEFWDNGLDPELCFRMTFRRIATSLGSVLYVPSRNTLAVLYKRLVEY